MRYEMPYPRGRAVQGEISFGAAPKNTEKQGPWVYAFGLSRLG